MEGSENEYDLQFEPTQIDLVLIACVCFVDGAETAEMIFLSDYFFALFIWLASTRIDDFGMHF